MSLIKQSYEQLFSKECTYETAMEYNRRLADFNANISLRNHKIRVHMNLQWKDIDEEIKIGLIQHLLTKLFKSKRTTQNIDLYTNFVKNIHILTPKTKSDPHLENAFHQINEQFSLGLELPNLQWGQKSFRKLAHYNFHNDTITMSTIFKDAPKELLHYVMYHEMLHKYFKFSSKNGRSSYHSREFRQAEKRFPNATQLEQDISTFIRKTKRKRFWRL